MTMQSNHDPGRQFGRYGHERRGPWQAGGGGIKGGGPAAARERAASQGVGGTCA